MNNLSVKKITVSENREITLYLEHQSFKVSQKAFSCLNINEGDVLTQEQFEQLEFLDAEQKCMKKALSSLAYSAKNEFGLKNKLSREFDSDIVDGVIKKLKEMNFLNDTDLALNIAERLAKKKKYGPIRISRELSVKGYCRDDIEQALAAIEPEQYIENIKEIISSKFGNIDKTNTELMYAVKAYLYKMGYSRDEYAPVLEEL